MSSRNWCFTINNPTTEQVQQLSCLNPSVQFLVASLEKGQQGTCHYQGYLELTRHRRLAFVKNLLPTAHLERRQGTAEQATKYCLKELTPESIEILQNSQLGTYIGNLQDVTGLPVTIMQNTAEKTLKEILSKQSLTKTKDNRLIELATMVKSGADDITLAEHDAPFYIQYNKGLQQLRLLYQKQRNHAVEVIVIQGPTGTGKSKWCIDNYPDAYWKQRSNWWDNYNSQEVVILDEFYGWIPFDTLLRLCDRYPLLVETKGGQVQFVAKTIIITTNIIPSSWYKNAYFKAFERRVSQWIVMNSMLDQNTYFGYGEAVKNMITI